MRNVAIVGSGLTAISAAKVLITRGVKPVIIDTGNTLDKERSRIVDEMSRVDSTSWSQKSLSSITNNTTITKKTKYPKKFTFGSDYFYGRSTTVAPVQTDGIMVPFSHAKGGFSVGWGASVLPPDDNDLDSWPIKRAELEPYFVQVMNDFQCSACDDGLSETFPLYAKNSDSLDLTDGNKAILKDLQKHSVNSPDKFLFGKARLLVNAGKAGALGGCRYCGYCMSGCVYECIYKSSLELDNLIASDLVEYKSNTLVHSVSEKNNSVEVSVFNVETEKCYKLLFDKVLIGAGAVNSTRIILQSKKLYDKEIRLLSTVAFIAPIFRIKRMKNNWPNINTLPGIFFEYKANALSQHWIHTQLSTPNEIVLDRLGIDAKKKNVSQWCKRKIVEHLIIAHGNIHSSHSNGYFISLKQGLGSKRDVLYSRRENIPETYNSIRKSVWRLFNIFRKFGCYVVIPFVRNSISSGSYHVGGTMPMKENPIEETDTNLLGNPKGWRHVHVIDSSIFPSLPATTIGLLAMANSARIASQLELD